MRLSLLLCLYFICIVVKVYCSQNNDHNNNLLNLISRGQTLNISPISEFTVGHERQCISKCMYIKRCLAFDVTEIARHQIECRIFEMTFDYYMYEIPLRGLVARSANTKLFSKRFPFKKSCLDWYNVGARTDGVYEIDVGMKRSVYCVMEGPDGGGWMAFQRRFDGSVSFRYLLWAQYKEGFGTPDGEHWLGNEALHQATSRQQYDMMVIATSFDSVTKKRRLKNFRISSESDHYTMNHDGYYPGYEDAPRYLRSRPRKFTTPDRDNDEKGDTNCAAQLHGAWWYNACSNDQMNGDYITPGQNLNVWKGICWHGWRDSKDNFVKIEKVILMVKPTEN